MERFFHVYQTNRPNILGGYCTYFTLDDAMSNLCPEKGINKIFCVVYENREGQPNAGCLCRVFSRGLVFSID